MVLVGSFYLNKMKYFEHCNVHSQISYSNDNTIPNPKKPQM